ncbi:Universal stress protein UspA [Rhodopirellula maiorica SM1]|uniref:Universal stress protein UspA n=1 Tax=Rhodopirellula maiorica SM1 TaxID=1265738 RepID=M5RF29_9BACT|nr:universal stress protein [Rhodopirellula maiorica]EMI18078.1 Universal stress protein UspA [Rhodopirellula maiorica SM1]
MKQFKSILVGVDLSEGDRYVVDTVPASSLKAISRAIWLAKINSAHLTFLNVLPPSAPNLDAKTQLLVPEGHGHRTVRDHAKEIMANLVKHANDEGIQADNRVVFGKSWMETIRQVIWKKHDLVIVGAKDVPDKHPFGTGSHTVKVLRKCPCAVWVTKSPPEHKIRSVLVAHDLRPVGDEAMELGGAMAELYDAELHVLHAIESPELDHVFPDPASDDNAIQHRHDAEQRINEQLKQFNLSREAHIHFATRPPDFAIWHCIEQYDIDLLAMGTLGRSGISGLITGNTAERLLPLVPCSILAVKPSGFESPVTLPHHHP